MMRSPEEIVDEQIEAYVRRDAAAFAAMYEEDAICSVLGSEEIVASGRAEIESVWKRTFSAERIDFKLENRIVEGRFVVDHEIVCFADSPPVRAVAAYLVGPSLIRRVWFLKSPGAQAQE
jgi:hypothetical protein